MLKHWKKNYKSCVISKIVSNLQETMEELYLCLPSNSSMHHYPDNHGGQYYTILPQEVELRGDYEVGLCEIMIDNSYLNVGEKEMFLSIAYGKSRGEMLYMEPGLYESASVFIDGLNALISDDNSPYNKQLRFFYNKVTRRVSMKIYMDSVVVRLSNKLQRVLCLDSDTYKGAAGFQGTGPVDVHNNSSAIYVYCDIIEARPVGDIMAPLLRILPIVNKNVDVIHQIYEKPHYIPIAKRRFNTMELLLATDRGAALSLEKGTTIVTLHFRRQRRRW